MRLPCLMLPVLALLGLAACETVKGAGRDLGAAGQALTNTSRQVQSDL